MDDVVVATSADVIDVVVVVDVVAAGNFLPLSLRLDVSFSLSRSLSLFYDL